MPAGIDYAISYDTAPFVKISIQKVAQTLAEAIRCGAIHRHAMLPLSVARRGGEQVGEVHLARAATDRPVVASGGITELADLEALQGLVADGVEGAIIGTALYEGRFTLEDALALTKPGAGAAS